MDLDEKPGPVFLALMLSLFTTTIMLDILTHFHAKALLAGLMVGFMAPLLVFLWWPARQV